jgi:mRNA guanylyltransferase
VPARPRASSVRPPLRQVEHLPHIFTHVQPSHGEGKHLFTFQDPLRKLKHGNDGIIFTPVVDAYVPGTCQSLLKWKPSNMNSIDFRISTKWRTEQGKSGPQPRFILMVADRATLVGYDWITFSPEQQQRFANDTRADERIIECVYDPKHVTVCYEPEDEAEPTWDNPRERLGGWKYERVREDKRIPNDIRTVESIKQSVADGVTQNELLQRLNLAQQGVSSDKGFGGM